MSEQTGNKAVKRYGDGDTSFIQRLGSKKEMLGLNVWSRLWHSSLMLRNISTIMLKELFRPADRSRTKE